MSCKGFNTGGERCEAPDNTLDGEGYCPAHRAGGLATMREIAAKGGAATKAKHDGGGFTVDELTALVTLEDSKLALVQVRNAVLSRRITDREANAATKAVSEWVKAEAALTSRKVVDDLTAEQARVKADNVTLKAENARLRKQIGNKPTLRIAK